MRSAFAPLLTLLTACASAAPPTHEPATPTPDLATVLAPETPRPAMVAPLTAILHAGQGEVLLRVGDETVRCVVARGPSRSTATCDDVVEEADTIPELVKKLHTGAWMHRLVQARIDDPTRFVERTGLELDTSHQHNPEPRDHVADPTAYRLGKMLGVTRFVVSERGESVQASFNGIEGPETIEAGSLFTLGQKLRARQQALIEEEHARKIRDADRRLLEYLLDQANQEAGGRWRTRQIVVGQTRLGQLVSKALALSPLSPGDSAYATNWVQMILFIEHRMASGRRASESAPLAGVVVQVVHTSARTAPTDAPLGCEAHNEWLAARETPFTPSKIAVADECRWSWSDASHRLDLRLSARGSELRITWEPDRFDRTEHATTELHPPISTRKHYRYLREFER